MLTNVFTFLAQKMFFLSKILLHQTLVTTTINRLTKFTVCTKFVTKLTELKHGQSQVTHGGSFKAGLNELSYRR